MVGRPPGRAAGRRPIRTREPILRRSSWPGRPSRGIVVRAVLVTALLALAFGVLYASPADGTCPPDPGTADSGTADSGPVRPPEPSPAKSPDDPAPPNEAAPPDGAAPPGPTGRLPLPAGAVGVPVRLTEPAALAFVSPGSRVDLLVVPATSAGAGQPRLLASDALVLDVVSPEATDGSAAAYLALQPDQAHRTVSTPADARFAIVVRSG